ncbi:hypothetical protein [Vulcanisaeta distributa]|uniref:hypothetical protein n=1 Tax=Vulcanisaeta distributa TaxID=164451 RepID=UPI0006D17A89|nr:hypothetical protein [Vulcanisaeta distributa]
MGGPVLDRVGLGAVVGVGRLFMDIIRGGVSDEAVIRDKYVVLIFDELDKWYRSMLNASDNAQVGYGPIEGEVMSYAEHFENFPTMGKVQAYLSCLALVTRAPSMWLGSMAARGCLRGYCSGIYRRLISWTYSTR